MRSQKSVMAHNFSQIPTANIQRSSFDRSHGLKTTFDSGWLVPILVDEALPGDTINCSMTGFARLATPIKPIMDNMFMETFFFAIPMRLVWDNWQKFNGEQIDPGDSTDFTIPQFVTYGAITSQSLEDYFGWPLGMSSVPVTNLYHRAYNLIWNEWFRDQNLQDSVTVDKGNSAGIFNNYQLLRRGKRHDYFTSALPWPQKGEAVNIPLGISAPVVSTGDGIPEFTANAIGGRVFKGGVGGQVDHTGGATGSDSFGWDDPKLEADLTSATAASINQLREGFQIQKMFERDARGGTRYVELLKSHFGVTSPDFRLQRPEYLGGGSSPVDIQPIAQTESSGSGDTAQGNLAAVGTSVLRGHGFSKSFTEHCMIIGLVNVRADLTYQQGLNRLFSRQTRFDFYWPALAHLGEQEILNKEIFVVNNPAIDELVFGYQERYAEYRYKPSQITGKFRSDDPQSLDVWHLSQDFATTPLLNASFIVDKPPIDRVVAVPSEPEFLFDAYFNYKCARPMPIYGVPGMIDHF